MINNVTLVGRLGHEVELRFLPSGKPVTRLRIATDASYTNSDGQRVEQADWHSVVVYGRSAENCHQYLGKGSLVYVEGSLKNRRWVDQEGQPHYAAEVSCRRIRFLGNPRRDAPPVDEPPQELQAAMPEPPEPDEAPEWF